MTLAPTFRELRAQAEKDSSWASVKDEVGLLEYVAAVHLGAVFEAGSMHARCPMPGHDDADPSFRVEDERWVCSCTNEYGDLGDLLQRYYQIDNAEALQIALDLREVFRASGYEPIAAPVERFLLSEEELWVEIEPCIHRAVNDLDPSGLDPLSDFLRGKGILDLVDPFLLINQFGIGWTANFELIAAHFGPDGRPTEH